ncbi:MAG: radical SAM protein [Eubacteriales bacterium]|jgi:histone acetyltransferase (RNA polymerase elongator complex component)|nr:radical SAM protein [Eubacteriales bacterium]
MKTHAIIPVFIPHEGCPYNCIFCNQKAITARVKSPSFRETETIIERYLTTIEANPDIKTKEIAFYGGSFTAIPMERQTAYLEIACKFKKAGRIDKIHMSTRPDYIDDRILGNLKQNGADVIELGVQSFDEEVLRRSARGHSAADVFRAAALIKSYGFELGIQLMTGLPGDTYEKCMHSVSETVKIAPSIARIYPSVVLENTAMCDMYRNGTYVPWNLEKTVSVVKDMYRTLTAAGINVIRVGLKSTDIIKNENGAVVGGYHPAFRQLVESEIAKEDLEKQLNGAESGSAEFFSNPVSFSNMIGNGASNKKYFSEKYPGLAIKFRTDASLRPSVYRAEIHR